MPNAMQIQALYMLRTLTGFVSGQGLQMMYMVVQGEPSPSGYDMITLNQLETHPAGVAALTLLARPFRDVLPEMAKYVIYKSMSNITAEKALELYREASTVNLMNMIRMEFGRTDRVIEQTEVLELIGMTVLEALPKVVQLLGISPNFQWQKPVENAETN